MRKPTGFTLIQFLVVIAIVAIFVALLFPALSAGRCRGHADSTGADISKCTTIILALTEEVGVQAAATTDLEGVTNCLTEAQKSVDNLEANDRSCWDKCAQGILAKAKGTNEKLTAYIQKLENQQDRDALEKAKLKNPADQQVLE